MEWNDVRFFLAIAETGSSSAAAKKLGVNQSTVSRRIQVLEDDLGQALFLRSPNGFRLTQAGQRLLVHAQSMEDGARRLLEEVKWLSGRPKGLVRVATIEEIAAGMIAPNLPGFKRTWPDIEIRLIVGENVLDLTKAEADISVRMVRPDQAGLVGRKLASFGMGIYASAAYLDQTSDQDQEDPNRLAWIMVNHLAPTLPEAEWLRSNLIRKDPILKCNSMKTLIAAVSAGLGVGMIPNPLAHAHSGLVRLPIDTRSLRREVWLVFPEHLKKDAAVSAVVEFIAGLFPDPLHN